MNPGSTVLICNKDVYTLVTMKEQLTQLGFHIITCTSRKEALELLENNKVEIVLAELNLEDSDASVLCQEIRSSNERSQPYIIIHSEKNEDFVQITSFNSGADDFVIDPIKPIILAARFKALLKRQTRNKTERSQNNRNLMIDHEGYKIVKSGVSYSLPRKEFEMFNLLYSNPQKVFTREEIAIQIWNNKAVAKARTIDIHIRNIRKRIGNEVIKTLKGIGYSIA